MQNFPETERGFFETLVAVVTRPVEFFESLPGEAPVGQPLVFGVIVASVPAIIGMVLGLLFQSASFMALPMLAGDQTGLSEAMAAGGLGIGMMIGLMVLMPLFVVIGIFIGAAVYHLCLMLLGGATHGFNATLRLICYASVSNLAAIVPICGGILGSVWFIILMVIGIHKVHETTVGKAVGVVLLPVVICCGCMFIMYATLFASLMASSQAGL